MSFWATSHYFPTGIMNLSSSVSLPLGSSGPGQALLLQKESSSLAPFPSPAREEQKRRRKKNLTKRGCAFNNPQTCSQWWISFSFTLSAGFLPLFLTLQSSIHWTWSALWSDLSRVLVVVLWSPLASGLALFTHRWLQGTVNQEGL